MADLFGFEPKKAESKSAVLPLHHRSVNKMAGRERFELSTARLTVAGSAIELPTKKFLNNLRYDC
jgi:alkylated DNA repair dioxygenase AlkB